MDKLTIFDDDIRIATVSIIGNKSYIFARSVRIWTDVYRWISQGLYVKEKKVQPENKKFLKLLAERAQSFNFNTELIQ